MLRNEELAFPIVENVKVNKHFVWVEPWHDVCLRNWKAKNVKEAHEKFVKWYRKEYPAKKVVCLEFQPDSFVFQDEEGETLQHHGYTLIVSK